MDRRQLAFAAVVVGALLVLVSALADPLGIGEGGGFGWKQTVGVVAGSALVVAGGWLLYGRRTGEPVSES